MKMRIILHKSCFELPKKTEHKSHPNHPLTLLSEPPQYSLYYDCNACGDLINGLSFDCEECDRFRFHVKCASLPESVECKAHSHALELRYYTPNPEDRYNTVCGVCDEGITEGDWSYFCKECDFSTDLECAFSAEAVPEKEEENDESEEEEEEEEEEENEDDDEDEDEEEEMSDQMRLFSANIRAMDQMAKLNFSRQMNQLNAQFVRNL